MPRSYSRRAFDPRSDDLAKPIASGVLGLLSYIGLAVALVNLTRHIPNVGGSSALVLATVLVVGLAQRWVVAQVDQDRDLCWKVGAGAVASAGVIAFVYDGLNRVAAQFRRQSP